MGQTGQDLRRIYLKETVKTVLTGSFLNAESYSNAGNRARSTRSGARPGPISETSRFLRLCGPLGKREFGIRCELKYEAQPSY